MNEEGQCSNAQKLVAPAPEASEPYSSAYRWYSWTMPSRVFHQRHLGREVRFSCYPCGRSVHRHSIENLKKADDVLLGRVNCEMMEVSFALKIE